MIIFLKRATLFLKKSNGYSQDSNTNPFLIEGVIDRNTVAV